MADTHAQSDKTLGTILIVDDMPENLRLLSTMLIEQGFKVRAIMNGTMAIASVEVELPDIVLLDINLPSMNGYEVCRRLKADTRTHHIPIIFISALDDLNDKVEAFRVGGVDYITKPFQVEEVLARVGTHLSMLRMHQQLQEQNVHLHQEIADRKHAEDRLQQANQELKLLVRELEQRNREMHLLNQLGDFLQRCQNIREAYSVSLPILRQLFPGQVGVLYMLSPEKNVFEMVTYWGTNTMPENVLLPKTCLALGIGRLHMVEDETELEQCLHTTSPTLYPYLCVQLVTRSETIGVLHIQHGTQGSSIAIDRWERLALMVADRLALSFSNLQLREQLREQSIRDPLTNLFNRRYLGEILERDIQRAIRRQHTIGFIMLDIDHFKRYNDTYGHDQGDVLLRTMATRLQENIRGEDVACRFGGEEFLLILPGVSLERAAERAETLRTSIKTMTVETLHYYDEDVPGDSITISLGVASFPDHGKTAEEVISRADSALYRAKETGRDRVVVAPLPGASEHEAHEIS